LVRRIAEAEGLVVRKLEGADKAIFKRLVSDPDRLYLKP
jgi:SOS-response transcriptional repressor LexA